MEFNQLKTMIDAFAEQFRSPGELKKICCVLKSVAPDYDFTYSDEGDLKVMSKGEEDSYSTREKKGESPGEGK